MVEPSLKNPLTGKRKKISQFVEGSFFVKFITTLIVINAVTLGFETNIRIMENYGGFIHQIDSLILSVFVIELALKFYAYRLSFFRSGWNVFDFLIVGIALVPASGPLAILRALRVLRILRLISVVPQMRRVITAIAYSIPGMLSVISVLLLIFYVASVLCTKLFGTSPDLQMQEWFGSIGSSAYTLFQIMTLESWSMGIVRPTMELYPWAWAFFVPFIIITSFAVLNLFIGIIVDAMQASQEEPRKQAKEEIKEFTKDELNAIHKRFDLLQEEIKNLK